MLIASVVLMLVACVALSAALCFVKKQSPFFVVLKCFFFASLICVGVCCASLRNAFDGYSILLILSALPLFFTLFALKSNSGAENFSAQMNYEEKNASAQFENDPKNYHENTQNFDNFATEKNTQNDVKFSKNGKKPALFAPNLTKILQGTAYAISAFCVAFCALYLGKESPYGFLAGLALGVALTFMHFLIKKKNVLRDPWGFCADFLNFLAVGFLVCAILPALLYSFALDNILFSIACLTYAAHILLETYLPNKFNHLALTAAYLLLFATIVF